MYWLVLMYMGCVLLDETWWCSGISFTCGFNYGWCSLLDLLGLISLAAIQLLGQLALSMGLQQVIRCEECGLDMGQQGWWFEYQF